MAEIPELLVSRELEAVGDGARRYRADRSKGRHRRLAPGVFVEARAFSELPDRDQHLLRARAVVGREHGDVLALHSAAALWDLPLLSRFPSQVHLLGAPGAGDGLETVRHRDQILPGDIVERRGFLVTSLERTVLDLARLAGVEDAVCALDHVLGASRGGGEPLLDRVRLEQRLVTLAGHRGIKQARFVVAFADGASESPGESASRLRMLRCGIPTPTLQDEYRDARGLIGRVDFSWPDLGTVGEFDGLAKYRDRRLLGDADPSAIVVREKLREDRLRATGLRVVRWTFAELRTPHALCTRLRAAGLPSPLH